MGRLLRRCRDEAGRDPQPSVALLDAQSVPSGRIGPAKVSEQTAANASVKPQLIRLTKVFTDAAYIGPGRTCR